MTPSLLEDNMPRDVDVSDSSNLDPTTHVQHREPLQLSDALETFDYFEVTPCIGREYRDVDLAEWLKAPNSDAILRDLAITSMFITHLAQSTTGCVFFWNEILTSTVSQRGVVFFRKQDNLGDEGQKELMQRLGKLSGKPSSSGLHIHPIYAVSEQARAVKGNDDEINVISSKFKEQSGKVYSEAKRSKGIADDKRGNKLQRSDGDEKVAVCGKKQSMKTEWHSDIAFENIPADYTMLRLTEVPRTGGDTLWASGYELYDRISPPYQKFLETLTGTYHYAGLEVFKVVAERHGFKIHEGPRGTPENVGVAFEAVHPLVRTNPVTGWKSLYAIGHHLKQINDLTFEEGKSMEEWFTRLLLENHDLQVRNRWQNVNDLAIWDNRCTYHAATPDHSGFGHRTGHRAVSVGERAYLDPQSKSRKEALGLA